MMEQITTKEAPQAIGPYSQGMVFERLVFASGQIHMNPETGVLVDGTIAEKTERCIKNAEAVLKAGGSDLTKVIKSTVFLSDMSLFAEMNKTYEKYFSMPAPARSCVAVRELPKGADVEIELIAYK